MAIVFLTAKPRPTIHWWYTGIEDIYRLSGLLHILLVRIAIRNEKKTRSKGDHCLRARNDFFNSLTHTLCTPWCLRIWRRSKGWWQIMHINWKRFTQTGFCRGKIAIVWFSIEKITFGRFSCVTMLWYICDKYDQAAITSCSEYNTYLPTCNYCALWISFNLLTFASMKSIPSVKFTLVNYHFTE